MKLATLHDLQQELVGGVDDAPGEEGAVVVEVRPSEKHGQASAPFPPHRGQHLPGGAELPAHLGLSPGLDHVQRVEHDPQACSQQASTHKIVHQVPRLAGGFREQLLDGPSQPEEEHVAGAVAEEDGHEAAVALPDAVLRHKRSEGVGRVVEAAVVPVVLEESLHALKRRQGCLHGSRHGCSKASGEPLGSAGSLGPVQ